jgi:hypothetical protein
MLGLLLFGQWGEANNVFSLKIELIFANKSEMMLADAFCLRLV